MSERTTDRTRDDVDVGDEGIDGSQEGPGVAETFGGVGVDDPDGTDLGPASETDAGMGTTTDAADASATGTSSVGRVTSRTKDVFSLTTFGLQLGAALVGVFVLGNLIPVIPFTGFLGLFLAMGLMGTLSSRPRYVEAALAGGASGALALFLGAMTLSVVTGGLVPLAGAAVGAAVAVTGFYAGRDLRDGMTKDL